MRYFLILIFFLSLLGCSSNSDNLPLAKESADTSTVNKSEKVVTKKKTATGVNQVPEIKELKFSSKVDTGHDLTLQVSLANSGEETAVSYRWFVNDKEVHEATINTLSREFFKVGDWIHCRVKAVSGGIESRTIRSRYVRVLGQPPLITLVIPEGLEVPGNFSYQIIADDPNISEEETDLDIEENKNTLNYELVESVHAGITIDHPTGLITWDITEQVLQKFPGVVKIKFKVSNKFGSATSFIKINLAKPVIKNSEIN